MGERKNRYSPLEQIGHKVDEIYTKVKRKGSYLAAAGMILFSIHQVGNGLKNLEVHNLAGDFSQSAGEIVDAYGNYVVERENFRVGAIQYGSQGWQVSEGIDQVVSENGDFYDALVQLYEIRDQVRDVSQYFEPALSEGGDLAIHAEAFRAFRTDPLVSESFEAEIALTDDARPVSGDLYRFAEGLAWRAQRGLDPIQPQADLARIQAAQSAVTAMEAYAREAGDNAKGNVLNALAGAAGALITLWAAKPLRREEEGMEESEVRQDVDDSFEASNRLTDTDDLQDDKQEDTPKLEENSKQ